MADYAPNYTARLRLRYTTGRKVHTMLFRGATVEVLQAPAFRTGLADFFEAMGPVLTSAWTPIGIDLADVNSDVFLPASWTLGAPSTRSLTILTPDMDPIALGFRGRTASGGRVGFWVYGTTFKAASGGAGENYRITSAESGNVSAGRVALLDLIDAGWRGPDNAAVAAVYPYANLSYNSYWQRKSRA